MEKNNNNKFYIYDPSNDCEHSDKKNKWCNKFDFMLIGDCIYCPIALKKNKQKR